MEGGGRAGGSGSGSRSQTQSQSQSQSQFGVSPPEVRTPPLTVEAISESQQVEAASPISSRPPAPSSLNYEELMRLSSTSAGVQMAVDDDALVAAAGEEADRGGGGGGGGNRWPRQETLALLKIRSDMDAAFRDATLKGPLWEEVSRKLAELGYGRSAKKCKEKFENVQKYYKRTKEGRGGRQDGKTYKFFSQLEALHSAGTTTSNPSNTAPTNVAASFSVPAATVGIEYQHITTGQVATPVSVGIGISNPTPISSVKISPTVSVTPSQNPTGIFSPADHFSVRTTMVAPAVSGFAAATTTAAPQLVGVSFSSDSSSSSTGSEDTDDDEGFDGGLEGEPSHVAGTSRKRRRGSSKGTESRSHRMMMEFFETLMKQVMHKQELMQQRFLETIEKREQDRMIREETWKRQEMARLTREQERMAEERAIAASRDAAIIDFLQKFTGRTIQLPQPVNISSTPQPHDVPVPPSPVPPTPTPPPPAAATQHSQLQSLLQQQKQYRAHDQQSPNPEMHLPSNTLQLVMHVPQEQRLTYHESDAGEGSSEPSFSRWPKPEVLALIKLRDGLDSRYQEAGPKGPLWEEISAGMQRMGYKRNAKRCKEKWENINKYFKKVKESNKKRREDSKTCPYFDELDALYRKKILGGFDGGSSRSTFSDTNKFEQDLHLQQENINKETAPSTVIPVGSDADTHTSTPQAQRQKNFASGSGSAAAQTCTDPEGLSASLFGEGTEEPATKPEDIVNELMELQDLYQQERPQLTVNEYVKVEEPGSNDFDQEDDDEEDCCSEDASEKRDIDYKIQFQSKVGNSNGVGSEFASMAVVQ